MATLGELRSEVVEVYIATFNRAPDYDGLEYWVNNMSEGGWSIDDVASSFFDSSETASLYPQNTSDELFINAIYNNVLGRDADSDGSQYWQDQMQNGMRRDQMIIAVINGAKASTGSADDKALLENKSQVGEYFAITLQLNDLSLARSTMALVDDTSDSVELAKDKQDAFSQTAGGTATVLEGTDDDDLLTSTQSDLYIYSWAGDDIITSGDGADVINSGSGNDTIYTNAGADTVYGRAGNDTIYTNDDDDLIYGNDGNDSLHGENGDDTIYGNDGEDYIYGDDGDDLLVGGSGADYINGGNGDDSIYGNDGDDIIYTKEGVDFVDAGAGNDIVYGGSGIDSIYGGDGNDTIYGYEGDDILDGITGDDTIYAASGDDTVNGNDGADILYGDGGDDSLDGEKGEDTIYGGAGADILTGGEDSDTFVFALLDSTTTDMDLITDFEYGSDKIRFVDQGSEAINKTAVDISAATTILEAIDIAATGDGSTNAIIDWFVYEDNTYIIEDMHADATFNTSSDIVVKLQGNIDFSTLNTSTVEFI